MVTPAQRAKKYGELSYEEYALWYASEIGVTEGDIAAAGKMRSVELIEDAVTALLPTVDEQDVAEEPTEEVYEATSELATPEEIGDSEDFPTDLTYDAMTVKELQALCKDRGLPVYGTKAEIALRLKRDDEGISESTTETEAPAEAAAEVESDTPAEEAAVTNGETNADITEEGDITETAE